MTQSVTVNGVTLTRAQVESALEELNKPEFSIPILARVQHRTNGNIGVVIRGDVQGRYINSRITAGDTFWQNHPLTVVNGVGSGDSYRTERGLLEVWKVIS